MNKRTWLFPILKESREKLENVPIEASNLFNVDYEPKTLDETFCIMDKEFRKNPNLSMRVMLYQRAITRISYFPDGTLLGEVFGKGKRKCYIWKMYWIARKRKSLFLANLPLFVAIGSWKDLFLLIETDLSYKHGRRVTIPLDSILQFIVNNINNDTVKKYLPSLSSTTKTLHQQIRHYIARKLVEILFGKPRNQQEKFFFYKQYRKLKASRSFYQYSEKPTIEDKGLQQEFMNKIIERHSSKKIG